MYKEKRMKIERGVGEQKKRRTEGKKEGGKMKG